MNRRDRGRAQPPAQLPGLDDACRTLPTGQPVVVPNPSPMTYSIIATTPAVINSLKGRPREQNVGVSVHDPTEWRRVRTLLDLDPAGLSRLTGLFELRVSALAPLRGVEVADWLLPAVRNGSLALFNGFWEPLGRLWARCPRVYGSSANRTGCPPAVTAGDARALFGDETVVVDGDALRDRSIRHRSSTMVRIGRDGTVRLHRSGAQDALVALEP